MGVKMIGCELGDGGWKVEERRWELEEKKETSWGKRRWKLNQGESNKDKST